MEIAKGESSWDVSRVVGVGQALYALVPEKICRAMDLKKDDRLVMHTDGRTIFATRMPSEELITKRTRYCPRCGTVLPVSNPSPPQASATASSTHGAKTTVRPRPQLGRIVCA
jgi:hypothetical protein